jgi:TPR repeat protein
MLVGALLAVGIGLAVAQNVTLDDLKIRAEAGDKSATRQLAEAYYLGREGAEQNFGEAARWYLKLAQQGDVRAQTTLGLMYIRGYGVKRDPAAARHWWTLAAIANDPGAQYNLGTLYRTGVGEQQDFAQAAKWFRQAAQRGHVQAQHDLGMLYHQGQGVEKDARWAYYWIKVAALQGDDKAEESLKKVAAGMSADQIREADRQAAEWMARAKKILK